MHNQHRSPDPTKIERATATSTVALFSLIFCFSLLFSLYINDIDDIAEGVSGAITRTAGVHGSHMLYADDLTLLTNEPRDMQIMLSRLAVYARNRHLIVNTSKSEVVHFNSAGENVPVFDVNGGATLHHFSSFF